MNKVKQFCIRYQTINISKALLTALSDRLLSDEEYLKLVNKNYSEDFQREIRKVVNNE